MKQRIGLAVAWFAATALAVAIASQAVGLVGDRAVEAPIAVPVAGAQSAVGPLTPSATTPPISAAPVTMTTRPGEAPTTVPPSTDGAPAGSTTLPPASTSVPPSTTTTVAAAATTVTTSSPYESGTFVVTGGQVTAACTGSSTIMLQGAVPVSGWSADVEESGPERVRVDFEEGQRESEVELRCDGGRLVSETADP